MKILVTGGTGMVGSAFKTLSTPHEIVLVGSKDYDLRRQSKSFEMIADHRPDAIIHLAARVGGVKGNTDFVADFFSENISINTNLLYACQTNNHIVKKVVSLLSTCVYPDKASYPLTEDQIHGGPPHRSNFGYAYAKRMLDVQSQAARQQYGCNFITAIPNNLFGENDNFHLTEGHVIPAIIRKVYEAKLTGAENVTFWGDGSPLREFTYAADVARALVFLIENYNAPDPINIGNTGEISIFDIANMIIKNIGYNGDVIWDTSMPAGQYRKPSSNERFLDLGWSEYSDFELALSNTCRWFIEHYPKVRGCSNA